MGHAPIVEDINGADSLKKKFRMIIRCWLFLQLSEHNWLIAKLLITNVIYLAKWCKFVGDYTDARNQHSSVCRSWDCLLMKFQYNPVGTFCKPAELSIEP